MDQAAFRLFYEKTAPALRAYAIRSCGSVDVADDLVQEAFLRFLRSTSAASLAEPQMRGYLYRTLESLMVDRWRRLQRERELAVDTTREPAASDTGEMDPDMTHAFSQLDHKQRSLLWLAYVEGFAHKEIAATTGVKEKSVKVLLFRARQKLAAILKRAGLGSEVL
jgi:RNA polymerase sigma-70 factor, ECF subfamily